MAHMIDVPEEPKDYKYAIIIDGLAYVLTEQPSITARGEGRVYIKCGSEFEANLSSAASWVLIPYDDWFQGCIPRAGALKQ